MAITINECAPPATTDSKPKRDIVAPVGFMKADLLPRELWPYHVDLSVDKYQLASGFPEEDRDSRNVTIEDVRGQETKLSLKEQAFLYAHDDCPELQELEKCEGDKDRIAALMVPAAARLVKRLTGAELVVPMIGAIIRNRSSFTPSSTGGHSGKVNLSAPQREVHFDNARWFSGKPMIHNELTTERETILTKHPDRARALELHESPDYFTKVINVWRPLKTIRRDPLVVCDNTSLDKENDRIPVRFLGPEGTHFWWQRNRLLYNPAQRWCYLSSQEPSEPLVFTIYDESQEAEDPAFGLAHCSAADPEYDNDAWPARESVESRYLAFVPKSRG